MKKLLPVAATLVTLAACGNPGFSGHQNPRQYLVTNGHEALPTRTSSYLGVYESGVPQSYRLLRHFSVAIQHYPNLVLYYSAWGEPFQTAFATKLLAHSSTPLVQIDPVTVSVGAIAAGHYDSYLLSYATQVREFGHPVVIGFAHEMNGAWYPWGYGHVPSSTWVAAWRHIVTVFRKHGADNVTWLWTVNTIHRHIPSPDRWWPGARYVTWVGIDGYYRSRNNTFTSVYGRAITDLRKLTSKPILLAEMAISPEDDPVKQIPQLFAEIRKHHLLGLVWFDAVAMEDWRLEDNPAALAEFRCQVRQLR